MDKEVLAALARVGVRPDDCGYVRLYHATTQERSATILEQGALRPAQPEDLAERMVLRGRGEVYLASAPDIGADLARAGSVTLAVDVPTSVDACIVRDGYGEPPRVEIVVRLPVDETVALGFADRLDRSLSVADLSEPVRQAIELFKRSEVGRQLADPDEREGRCWRSASRFLSALRECGADGSIRCWTGAGWTHGAVEITGSDIVVDWTASQFEPDHERAAAMPYPLVLTRAQADATRRNQSYEIPLDDPFFRPVMTGPAGLLPEPIMPWPEAQKQIAPGDADARNYRPS